MTTIVLFARFMLALDPFQRRAACLLITPDLLAKDFNLPAWFETLVPGALLLEVSPMTKEPGEFYGEEE